MKSAELNITSPYSKFGRIKVLYSCSLIRLGILFPIAFSIPNFLFAFVESLEMWLAQDIWLRVVNPRLVCSDTSSNNILLKVICIFDCGRFLFVTIESNWGLLKSSNTNMLTVPRYRTKWGSRSFAVAAPSTWNSLPVYLRTASTVTLFNKMLKTFLFDSTPPPPKSSEIRRPVDDLSFDSRHWPDFDLDSAPLSSYLRGFRRYRSYRIELI